MGEGGADLMPVDPLGNGDAAVPGQACDVFEGDAVSAEQADSGVPTAENLQSR